MFNVFPIVAVVRLVVEKLETESSVVSHYETQGNPNLPRFVSLLRLFTSFGFIPIGTLMIPCVPFPSLSVTGGTTLDRFETI